MKTMAIPRGKISHSVLFDTRSLLEISFSPLNNQKIVKDFETKFASNLGLPYAVSFPLARTAIHAVLSTKKFAPGSKIIMPAMSIKGILDVVLDLGLEPIFVDIDPIHACFDPAHLLKAIGEKPVAAIVTYLFGLTPDVEKIISVLRRENIYIIEDISQALNATFEGRKLGTFGDCAVYSSSAIKTLDMYGGGVLATSDERLISGLQQVKHDYLPPKRSVIRRKILKDLIRNVATKKPFFTLFTFPLMKLASRVNPSAGVRFVGKRDKLPIKDLPKELFYNFSSFQAKVGLKLLENISDNDKTRSSIANYVISKSHLNHVRSNKKGIGVHWQNIVYVKSPERFMRYMRKNGIDTAQSSLILLSELPAYGWLVTTENAKLLYENGVYLPCYSSLNQNEATHLVNILNAYVD